MADDVLSRISNILELPEGYRINFCTRIADVPGWDLFAWIAVIGALEDYCGSELPVDRIDAAVTVADLVDFVEKFKTNLRAK